MATIRHAPNFGALLAAGALCGTALGILHLAAALAPALPPQLILIASIILVAVGYRLWASTTSIASAFIIGLTFGLFYFGTALHWLGAAATPSPTPTLLSAPEIWTLSGALMLFFPFWGVWFGLASMLRRALRATRPETKVACFTASFMIATLSLGEWVMGLPLAPLSRFLLDTALENIVPIIGQFGSDTAFVLISATVGASIGLLRKALALGSVAAVSIIPTKHIDPVMRETAVYMAQPSAPHPSTITGSDHAERSIERIIDLIDEGVSSGADIIAFPESALPDDPTTNAALTARLTDRIPQGTSLIIGFMRAEAHTTPDGTFTVTAYNSAALLSANGIEKVYDKTHLVPFGETLPEVALRNGFSPIAAPEGGFGTGSGIQLFPDGFALAICFEVFLPGALRTEAPRAEWVLNISSEALFRGTVGPDLLLGYARLRALETGLPVLRSTAHAYSGTIDARGQILDILAPEITGGVLSNVPEAAPSVFFRHGSLITNAILVLLLVISARDFRGYRKSFVRYNSDY